MDYPHPGGLTDDKQRADEAARIALQSPVYANVEIPLSDVPAQGRVEMTIRLHGDAKLCWLRCIEA